ncbi:NFACT RNA binding domain-containing protein [Bacteroidota bacterium]
MIRHYYTLHHVVKEMQELVGCRLVECFSQEKNSLVFVFYDGSKKHYLQYNGNPQITSLFMRKSFSRANKNTVDLFDVLIDEVLQNISLIENDRIIRLDFIYTQLFVFLFSGSKSNLLAVNSEEIIIDSLKDSKKNIGQEFVLPFANLKPLTEFEKEAKINNALSRCDLLLGKYYAEELLIRMGIDGNKPLCEFSGSEIESIIKTANDIKQECLDASKYYLFDQDGNLLLSLIPLKNYVESIDTFDSISGAIYKRMVTQIKEKSFSSIYNELIKQINKQIEKLERNIEGIKDEEKIIERSKKYRLWAELLMSHPEAKMKSGKSIELIDYNGNNIKIQLDEKLTLISNASKYFDKATNAKAELKVRKKRLPELELRLLKLRNTLKLLDEQETVKELQKFKKNLKQLAGISMSDDKNDTSTKFREFDLGEGYILYVGKNAASNDELTMKFAKPNDMWFHSRGSGGSHAVLRLNKDQKPPKAILKKAGAIVAYYSQARKAKYTPVAYTYKKYVRKPKGANPGSVVIAREEVIMVEPGLPNEESDN